MRLSLQRQARCWPDRHHSVRSLPTLAPLCMASTDLDTHLYSIFSPVLEFSCCQLSQGHLGIEKRLLKRETSFLGRPGRVWHTFMSNGSKRINVGKPVIWVIRVIYYLLFSCLELASHDQVLPLLLSEKNSYSYLTRCMAHSIGHPRWRQLTLSRSLPFTWRGLVKKVDMFSKYLNPSTNLKKDQDSLYF